MLKILEPTILPTARPSLFSKEDIAETNISGAEVPKATMVRPIAVGEIWKFRTVATAPIMN